MLYFLRKWKEVEAVRTNQQGLRWQMQFEVFTTQLQKHHFELPMAGMSCTRFISYGRADKICLLRGGGGGVRGGGEGSSPLSHEHGLYRSDELVSISTPTTQNGMCITKVEVLG